MECKCKYYLRNEEGILVCSVCGKPAPGKIEDKVEERHEDKAQIWPPESPRITRVVKKTRRRR